MINLFKKGRSNRKMQIECEEFTPSSQFINANLKREISSLAEDLIQPYNFEKNSYDNVYHFAQSALFNVSMTVKDVVVDALMGQTNVINIINLEARGTPLQLLIRGTPDSKGALKIEDLGTVKPLKSLVFESIFSIEEIDLVRRAFSMLWYAYERQKRIDLLDSKFIFKMQGFHSLFTQPKNDEESFIAKENRNQIVQNVQDIIDGRGGVIDANDQFGLMSGENNFLANKIAIENIYSEIARILKIPLTRLLGRAPQGMNATGDSDADNYRLTLDRIRSGWVDPFLNQAGIQYTKVARYDIQTMKDILDMYQKAGITPSQSFIAKIERISEIV